MRTTILLAIPVVFVLCSCAKPEQVSNEVPVDAPPAYGVGGTMWTVNGVKVWLNGGTPTCVFRVLSTSNSNYWTGAAGDPGRREQVIKDLAAAAARDGADGVIVYRESKEITGFVAMLSLRVQKETQPGLTGSNITYSMSSAQYKCLPSGRD